MKVAVITGSGHAHGTSALLADKFIQGATESGHKVFRFDAAMENLHPCLACDRCAKSGKCFQPDGYDKLIPHLLDSEVLVFVTPIYYYGMTAALKTVFDRFHQLGRPMDSGKKTILMATAWDSNQSVMEPLVVHYKAINNYLGWQDIGMVLALGAGTRSSIERSHYPEKAYQLGKNLK